MPLEDLQKSTAHVEKYVHQVTFSYALMGEWQEESRR